MLNNLREICDHYHVTRADYDLAVGIVGSGFRQCDLPIMPDGNPYLFRWHVVPHNHRANVFFHIQVADDPKRPLHDHPWDNMSVILSGGYTELLAHEMDCPTPDRKPFIIQYKRLTGAVIHRDASDGHRLLMPEGVPYTMTLFTTGPKRRRWGFWYPEGWVDAAEVCHLDGNVSKHIRKEGA